MRATHKQQTHYDIAIKAVRHARAAIPHGVTRLENNYLPAAKEAKLVTRLESDKAEIRAQRDAYIASRHWIDPSVAFFESRIIFHTQFKVGECKELCIVALDHIARNFPQADAEIFQIAGEYGNHGFIVIGRAEGSDPQDPMTWGEDAYIVDPWMDRVFPTNEYQRNLVNYYSYFNEEDPREYNAAEVFDAERHTLEPQANMTTQHLRTMNSAGNLNRQYAHFKNKVTLLKTAVQAYRRILVNLKSELRVGIFTDAAKIRVLDVKIGKIDTLLGNALFSLPETHTYTDYRMMTRPLHNLMMLISSECKFNEADRLVISKGSGGLSGLFARQSDTARQVESIGSALERLDLSLRSKPSIKDPVAAMDVVVTEVTVAP